MKDINDKTKVTRNKESNNGQNTILNSELLPFGYDDSSLSWYVRYIFDNFDSLKGLDDYQLHIYLEKIFNDFLSVLDTDRSLSKTVSFSRKKYLEFIKLHKVTYDIKIFDICEDKESPESVNIADRIAELYDCLDDHPVELYPVYNDSLFKKLIENFFKLSAECVFNLGNTRINSLLFRNSKTLESLYSIGKIPFEHSDIKREKGYAYYNVCSPFVAEPFLKTVMFLEEFIKSNCLMGFNVIPEIKQLYAEIFINKMNRSFMRFTSYNGSFNNFRVTLNRHCSELISVPYNELSSIENVKPLHLFEKIISHLYNRLKENNTNDYTDILKVNIGVIGHAEVSYSNADGDSSIGEYREVYDLLRMVIDWYTRIADFGKIKVPKLELTISYFVNEGDVLCSRSLDNSDDTEVSEVFTGEYKEECNVGRFNVKTCSYFSEFLFSKKNLLELINQNDVMFILDCPWMTEENYELENEGLLDFYCMALKRELTNNDLLWENIYNYDIRRFPYGMPKIKELDTNYNRITSSDTIKAGNICRDFKGDILRAIEDYTRLKKSDSSRKDVYIYTSEKVGVDYSFLASYPTTKAVPEYIDGKNFTITHFSNRKFEALEFANDDDEICEDLCFHIRLWNLLRYIAVSYAFVYFRKQVDQIFSGDSLSPEDYFELLRAIIVEVDVSGLKKVDISIGYDENILKALNKNEKLLNKLFKLLKPFIEDIFRDIIFSNDKSFEHQTFKNAFEACILDCVKNIESLIFYEDYVMKRKKQNLSSFDLVFNYENYKSFYKIDNFYDLKDKCLYRAVLSRSYSRNPELNIGLSHSLRLAQSLYNYKQNIRIGVIKNIIKAYEKNGLKNTEIYKNIVLLKDWSDKHY